MRCRESILWTFIQEPDFSVVSPVFGNLFSLSNLSHNKTYTLLCYFRYDFAVYGLLAPEIGASFFPKSSEKLQLINSFGVNLAAFLMRPLGAIFFGEMGDRILGRKNALVFSIVLITVPSILMGCLPTYHVWGVVSPILLVLLRMMQGLSVGGQLAGSYVLSIEQSSSRSRGFRGSICDASSVCFFLSLLLCCTIVWLMSLTRLLHTVGGLPTRFRCHYHDPFRTDRRTSQQLGLAAALSLFSPSRTHLVSSRHQHGRIKTMVRTFGTKGYGANDSRE